MYYVYLIIIRFLPREKSEVFEFIRILTATHTHFLLRHLKIILYFLCVPITSRNIVYYEHI